VLDRGTERAGGLRIRRRAERRGELAVHHGQQIAVEHAGGRLLLRRLEVRERRQDALALGLDAVRREPRAQSGDDAALPVDQRAIAVEAQHREIGQPHDGRSPD
jgi:hypothetical protein